MFEKVKPDVCPRCGHPRVSYNKKLKRRKGLPDRLVHDNTLMVSCADKVWRNHDDA
jgi:hypothetical protein